MASCRKGTLGTVAHVASERDRDRLKRQGVIHALLLVVFVFRRVFAHDRQGYAVTPAELWEQCRRPGVAPPPPVPVSSSSMCTARARVHEEVFRPIDRAVLEEARRHAAGRLWHGHRAFTVDGTKLNLPCPLTRDGYRAPSPPAHYPQGLLSCPIYLRE